MEPQLIEWGPAHLRDEATVVDVEPHRPPRRQLTTIQDAGFRS